MVRTTRPPDYLSNPTPTHSSRSHSFSATTLGVSSIYRRFFKRIKGTDWITPDLVERKRWITGIVTRCVFPLTFVLNLFLSKSLVRNRVTHRVGDADNFRLYHTPGFGWRGPFKFRHVPTSQKGAKTPNEIAAAGVLTFSKPEPKPKKTKSFAFSCQTLVNTGHPRRPMINASQNYSEVRSTSAWQPWTPPR